MAITVTELAESTDTSNTTSYATASYTPTANRVLLAYVAAAATIAETPTFVGNGLTWTLEFVDNATNSGYLFSAPTGSSPSAGVGTFDCTGDDATGCIIHVVEVDGGNLTTPITQISPISSAGSGTTPSITFSDATASDCAAIGYVRNNTNPFAVTAPSGWTELMDTGHASPNRGAEMAYHASPGAVTTVTWGSTSASVWRAFGVEVAIAPAAGGFSMNLGLDIGI